MTESRHLAAALLAMAVLPAAASTPAFQDLDALDRLAGEAAAGSGLVPRPIDRRLRLVDCPEPPLAARSPGSVVTLACPSRGWQLRVPLDGVAAAPGAGASGAPIVRRGDAVTLIVEAQGFSVEAAAVAEDDARRGERVRVRTAPKSPVATAEAVAPGLVKMRGFN